MFFSFTELSGCLQHVKKFYIESRFNIQKQVWQLLHPKHFVNVLLIHHMECSSREREIVAVATIMRHGLAFNKVNSLMDGNDDNVNSLSLLEYYAPHTKPDRNLEVIETNRISDIFKRFQKNDNSFIIPMFILIEGAPGMGKTILCKEIAYQWANQYLLKDTKLLFLIHLRDLAISNIVHLKDLIHYLYAFDEAAIELSIECAKILNESNGDGLTILFDGFDEFDSSSNSLITNILGRKVLPQCKIVVTSRLTASDRLHRLADVRVEIMGFTDESKMQYIEQELEDHPDEINKLQSYLDDHPSIKSICYMPMMMTILVYVFKEKRCLPNNPTELYEIFVALTISHHLQKQMKSEHLFTSVQTLPTGCKSFLTDLSEFAFLTLQSKQKIFTKGDIEKYCPNSVLAKSTLDNLGLINSVEFFCIDRGHSTVFNFLHLSIHEYLAALYISSIDQCMQFKELENTFLNEMCQGTWNMFTAMSKSTWLTFQNYCVYCKDSYQESLSTWIANVKSSSFAECITELCDSLHDIQISSKIIQILFSQSTQSPKSNAYLQQIYLSLSSRQHIKQIEVQMFIFDKGTNDLYSKWFAITEKLRLTDRFSVVFCTNNVLMLKNINQLDKFKFKTAIKWFSLVHCHISRSIIKVIVNHLNLYNVSRFDIVSCTFDDGEVSDELTSTTQPNQALSTSHLCGNNLKHSAVVILQALSKLSSLNMLNLQSNQLDKDAGEYISSIILSNAGLKVLVLDDNNLNAGVLHIAKALQHHSTLEVLSLGGTNIPAEVYGDLALAIDCNQSLKVVQLHNNNLQSSAVVILQALSKLSSLTVLNLQSNELTEDVGECISYIVLNNNGLNQLFLGNNDIGRGALPIAKALQKINSLQVLELGDTNLPKEVCDELALVIEHNQCLTALQLNNNDLQCSAVVILQTLSVISSLRVLRLQSTQLNEDVGEYVSSIILNNTGINKLILDNNDIGKGVLPITKALQQLNSLQVLGLRCTNMPQDASNDLALAIKCNKHLYRLNLSGNNLQSAAVVILQALCNLTSLKVLDLRSNELSEDTGEYLSHLIFNNPALHGLGLDNSNIGKGVLQIAKALQSITSLKILRLGYINFPAEVCSELALAIQSNQCLDSLWLSCSGLNSNVLQSMISISTLTDLNLISTQVLEEAGEVLSSIILHNTKLVHLRLSNNSLGNGVLHVTKAIQHLTQLRTLHLSNVTSGGLVSEECGEALSYAMSNNSHLEDVDLSNNNIQAVAVHVVKGLQQITSLKVLNLGSCNLPKEISAELAQVIDYNKCLEQFLLPNNNLGSSMDVILQALNRILIVKVVNLQGNQITVEYSKYFASVISKNNKLEQLLLGNNNLGEGVLHIVRSLQGLVSLQVLDLSNTNMPKEACNELALVIERNQCLTTLQLNNNDLQCSAVDILQALSKISSLRVLHLQSTQLNEDAGEYVSSIILNNTGLNELILDNNNIGKGVLCIAKALRRINSLQVLRLKCTNIPKVASNDLALVIKHNKHLYDLDLSNNNLQSAIVVILQALCHLTSLKVLDLRSNELSEDTGEYLSHLIFNNPALHGLGLDNNNIGKGVLQIAKALQSITSLKILRLGYINFPAEVCSELALAIQSNQCLDSLWLPCNSLNSNVLQSMISISTLTDLNLNSTQLLEEAGEVLSSIILHNTKLVHLRLSNNSLGNGALHVMKAIQRLTQLRTLHLSNVTSGGLVSEECGEALSYATSNNNHLEDVDLSNNNIQAVAVHVVKGLQQITSLKVLNLGSCNLPKEISANMPKEACNELALVIERNQCLTTLQLNNNDLQCSAVDILQALSKISSLRVLHLQSTQLNEDAGECISYIVLNNNGLNQLFLGNNDIGRGALPIAKVLQKINSLQVLGLGDTNLPKEVCDELALVIERNQCLTALQLNNNDLQCSAVDILQALSKISSLRVLHLQSTQLNEDAGEYVSSIILNNTGLNELILDNNNIGKGVLCIAKALRSINSLQVLRLKCTNIPKVASNDLALVIKHNKHLYDLDLSNNNLQSAIVVILQALCHLTSLKVLDLRSNELSEDTGEYLSHLIFNNPALHGLGLDNNNIGKGVLQIAKALQSITSLKILRLGYINFPAEVCSELALAIQSNQCLDSLWLPCNSLNSNVLQSMISISTLTDLNLNSTQLLEEAGEVLSSIILHNTKLVHLRLSNNSLGNGALHVMKAIQRLTQLRTLHLSNVTSGGLVSEECGEALSYATSNNNHLEDVDLSNNNIQAVAVHVVKGLQQITSLKVLNLGSCNLPKEISANMPKEACNELALVIERNQCLTTLQLNNNDLQCSAVDILQALSKISSLRVLHLQSTQLNEDAGEYVSSIILNNTGLNELILDNNNIGKGVLCIAKALRRINSLQVLRLKCTNIPKVASNDLALVIKHNKHLYDLDLSNNNLQSAIVVILQALCHLTSLKVLDLRSNELSEDTGEYLSHLIFNNPALHGLGLDNNNIGKGVLQIAKALQSITSLKILRLGYINFPAEVCSELALAIQSNQCLDSLWLPCNSLNSNVLQSMISISTLTDLNLNSTQLLEEAGEVLSSIILHNTKLVHLRLSNNSLGNGALHVMKAIQRLTQLRTLHLSNVTSGGLVSEECGEALSYATSNNNHLEDVDLSNNNIQAVAVHVVKGLQQITSLKVLNLGSCNLPKEISANMPKEACNELALVIERNQCLTTLQLNNNDLQCSAVDILQALSKISSLRVLHLQSTQLNEDAGEYVSSIILNNTGLNELILDNNNIGKGVLCIAKALRRIDSLQVLRLKCTNIPKVASNDLALVIKHNKHLYDLDLSNNNLQSAIVVILQALCHLTSLKVLDLRSNELSEDTGEYLSHLIFNNPALHGLGLDNNNIGKGVLQIAKALQSITSLKILRLGYINFPVEVCDKLALAIQSNQCLESLWLPCNGLNSNVLQSMISISTLTDLNLISTQLLEEAGEVLSCIILHNTKLVHLRLSNNSLGNGALHVMKAIQHLTQLRTLHLGNVTSAGVVSEECGEALSCAMNNNNHLEDVDLSNNNIQAVAVHVVKGLQQITSLKVLNLGNCNLLKKISAEVAHVIDCNKYLEQLLLPNNNLGSSAVVLLQAIGRVSKLKVLSLQGNQITEEAGEYLASAVVNNDKLEQLLLSNNYLCKGVSRIARSLQGLVSLRALDLGNTNMPKEACNELASAIACNKHLHTVQLYGNNLQSSIVVILQSLSKISSLKVVNLQSNQLNEDAVGHFLSLVICNNIGLNQIFLDDNNIGKGALPIAKALQQLNSLQVLDLGNTNFPKEAADELALVIECNQCLNALLLNGNDLRCSSVVILQGLSKLSSLRVLNLQSTQLNEHSGECMSSIISNNTGLSTLLLDNNDIGKGVLPITKALQQLNSLQVLGLRCTNMPNETSSDLALAIKYNKHLYNLSLSGNNLQSAAVVILQALCNLSSLKILHLRGTQLTESTGEHLSRLIFNNPELNTLGLSNNNIGKGVLQIAKALQNITSLKILDLGYINFPAGVCDELALAIQSNQCLELLWLPCNGLNSNVLQSMISISTLTDLNLNSTQLLEEAGEVLSSIILHNSKLVHLCLSNNSLGNGALHVMKAIQHLTQLRTLHLSNVTSGGVVSEECGEALSYAMSNNNHLEDVDLSNNNIQAVAVHVVKGLQHNASLKVLNLGNCNLAEEISAELAHVINCNKYIEQLLLPNNNLGCSADIILQALSRILTLKVLSLGGNLMTEEAGEYFASVISNNHKLERLLLGNNNLNKGVLHIARSLQGLVSLQVLDLGNTNMPNEVCKELALAVNSNQLLNVVQLYGNHLHSSGVGILQALSEISSLRVLDLHSNQVNEDAGKSLSSIILNNTGLHQLLLNNNDIGEGVLLITKALQQLKSLQVLDLSYTNMPKEAFSDLALVIKFNKYLRTLRIDGNNLQPVAVVILQALCRFLSLKILDLNANQMSEYTSEYLSRLIYNHGLNGLLLSGNNTGNRLLCMQIARAVQNATSLEGLGLGYNSFPAEVCDQLALAIHSDQCLELLWLPCNGLNSNVLQSMISISTLTDINLKSAQLLEEAGEILSSIILHNTKLVHLRLSNNSLGNGALHVMKAIQHLTQLRTLHLSNVTSGGVVSEECGEALSYTMSNNNHLEDVDLSNNNIQAVAVHVVKGLQQITSLKVLNLGNCNLSKKISAEVAHVIDCNKYLEQLLLPNNNLGSSAVVLLQAVGRVSKLKVLGLQGNQITEEASEYLASAVVNNDKLEQLLLNNNYLCKGVSRIARSLQGLVSLRALDLGNTNMPKEACNELASAIACNKHLHTVQLYGNNLQSSIVVILQSLSKISSLKVVNLQSNQLNEDAVGHFLSLVICNNIGLNQIFLDDNNIGKGALPIAKALQQLNSLQVLDLGNTNFPKEAADELALVIECNQCLNALGLNGNDLQCSAVVILQGLSKLSSLRVLNLQFTQLNEHSGEYMSSIISNNTGLSALLLDNNDIGKGVLPITKALQQLNSLQVLGLRCTNMPQDASNDLALAIKCNKHLYSLNLSGNNLQSAAVVILQALCNLSSLKTLYLQGTQLTESTGEYLSRLIFNNPELNTLGLSNNSNIGKRVLQIAKALQNITSLKILGLGYINFPAEVCDKLALAIQTNQCLELLWLPCNGLNSNVLQSMISISTLTDLNLNGTQLLEEAGEVLSSIILQNTKLVHLRLSNNSLGNGALHVMKAIQRLTQLRTLHLSNVTSGGLVSEECGEALSYATSNNNHLEDVDLSNNNIQAVAVHVVKGLQQITSLKVLNLGSCYLPKEISANMPKEACNELALVIERNQCLTTLQLNNNDLQCSAVDILQALSKISSLRVLHLQSTQLNEDAGEYVSSIILNNTGLNELILDNNNIGKGVLCIAKALRRINSLQVLRLKCTNIPKVASNDLALVIKHNKHLYDLDLSKNNLQSAIVVILQALCHLTSLKVLDLRSNELSKDTGEYLSHLIFNNPALHGLDLDNNNIDKGVLQIAKALQSITSLKILGLGYINFPAEVCSELALAIQSNQCLESLWLPCNSLNSNVLQSMISISTLTDLNLNSTQLLEEAGEVLSSIILHNTKLVHLRLSNNSLGNGALHVMKAIQRLTQLRTLHLSNVTSGGLVSEECGEALLYATSNNNHLEDVDLSNNNIQAVAVHVVKGLQQITSLKVLNLGSCNLPKEISANMPKEACNELALVIERNQCLTTLQLNNNDLQCSAVDILQALSKISSLRVLHLQSTQLNEDAGECISYIVLNNNGLNQLFLGNNDIGRGALPIAKALQKINSLQVLGLGDTNLPKEVCDELALVIERNQCLTALQLNNNDLQCSAVDILQALSKISSLRVLHLQSTQLNEDAGEYVSSIILNNTGLNELILDNNNIGKGVLCIAKALRSINSLQVLRLKCANIPKVASNDLALVIIHNKHLYDLDLSKNNLQSAIVVILQALCHLTSLKVLDLSSNELSEDTGEYLAHIICNNHGLISLFLDNNNIGKGMLHIAKALQNITPLIELSLEHNRFPAEVCSELALAIQSNQCLESLWLPCNSLNSNVLQSMISISTLTELNLNSTQLLEAAGEVLSCIILHNTRLVHLALSNNSLGNGALHVIKAIQHLTQLRILHLGNITSGGVVSEECGEALSYAMSNNNHLEDVNLSNNNIQAVAVHVVNGLQQITSLKVLNLGNCNLPKEAFTELAHVINCNKCLGQLLLPDNNLGSSAVIILDALSRITTLKVLDLGGNQITEEAGEYFTSVINKNHKLEQLLLSDNNLGKGVLYIARSLHGITSLRMLDLGNIYMPKEACNELARVINCNPLLSTINLYQNNLQSAIVVILQALSQISSLRELDLESNQLNEDVGEYLSSVILNNVGISYLDLDNNNINKGMFQIVKALQQLHSLQVLRLSCTNIPKEALNDLALVIKCNKYLHTLRASNNNLSCSGLHSNVLQSMISISTLKELALNSTQLLEEAGEILSSIILHNTKLVYLDLSNNGLGNGALHVMKALQHLTQLRTLHLGKVTSGGVVSEECGEALSYAMSNNNHLEDVNLSNNNIQAVAVHVVKGLQQITSLKVLNLGNCNLPKEISSELAHVINCNKYLEQLLLCNNNLSSSMFTRLQALSKFSTLKVLDIRGNQITEEAGEYFTSVINKNHKLEKLLLSDNNLGKGVLYIARSLHGSTSLRMLDLGNIYMPKEACNELARVINCNPLLSTINLYRNNLQSAIVVILQALSQISSLRELDLESNQLNEDVGEYLSSVILNNVGISNLDLDNNNINKGMFQIVKALQQLHSLQVLCLSCTNIPKEALNDLALVIKCNKYLHTLRASNNNLSCSGLHSNVLQSMISISTLKELNLNSTQLLEEAGEILSSIILHNTRLVHLDLSNNSLGNGALHVMKAIQHLTQLRTLHLSNVTSGGVVSEECGEALSYAMSNNNHLEDVDLSNNNIQAVAVHVVEGLQQITSLKVLNLGNCNLPKEMSTELAHVIDSNICLEQLLLPDNNLSTSVVIILEALSRISTLKVLDLQGNQIIEESGEYFASAITNNNKLEKLLLGNNNIGKGVTHITRSLQVLDSLKVLNLSNTNMSNEMCSELTLAVNCNQFSDTAIIW